VNQSNSLKRIRAILNECNFPVRSKGYSAGINNFHKNLSIKENIELDILNRVFSSDELSIENLSARLKRLELFDYFKMLRIDTLLHKTSKELTNQEMSLYSHFKAIARGSDIIIFESPENYLESVSIDALKTCVRSCSLSRPIIIISKNQYLFNDLIDTYINDNENLEFNQNLLKQEEEFKNIKIVPTISA
jgi:hypothetical protein